MFIAHCPSFPVLEYPRIFVYPQISPPYPLGSFLIDVIPFSKVDYYLVNLEKYELSKIIT